jgi:molybdenum cofactor guanylyltransferase
MLWSDFRVSDLMPNHRTMPAYIAAGGRSSRFGSDKALADIHGRPMLAHVASQLQQVASEVIIVADRPGKYDHLGFVTIGDLNPGKGPLGALQTALHHASGSDAWLLLTSCDLAGIRGRWIEQLIEQHRPGDRAIAFHHDQRWEPLLALYHASLAEEVDRRIATDDLAMWCFLDACGARRASRPTDWQGQIQINTPEDLVRFGEDSYEKCQTTAGEAS